MERRLWIPNGKCTCCGTDNVEVKEISTTVVPVYICRECLEDSWELYLGSEGV